MNRADLEHKLNGTSPMPKCDNFKSLGAVRGYKYGCPKCMEQEDYYDIRDGYYVNGENYPKYYNESKGHTIEGDYWDWDELHVCKSCKTKYWIENGAY